MFGSIERSGVEPGDVGRVVRIEDVILALLVPCDDVGPFDAVLGLTGDGGECAERDGGAGRAC